MATETKQYQMMQKTGTDTYLLLHPETEAGIVLVTSESFESTNVADALEEVLSAVAGDLSSYYTKTETDTLLGDLEEEISAIPKFTVSVVDALPDEGDSATVYLLKTSETESGNLYTEYLYVDGAWESLGTQTLDLSGYATVSDIEDGTITAAKATSADTATTATTATSATTADYATSAGTADTATTATTATSADYATSAGTATSATTATSADYATSAGTADTATSATSATTAATADALSTVSVGSASTPVYFDSAGVPVACTSVTASSASTADYATSAGSADTATTATTATSADYATSAGTATSATTATSADYATSAGTADSATTATTATTAATADALSSVSVGSASTPVYFDSTGVPVACTSVTASSASTADYATSAGTATSATTAETLGTSTVGGSDTPVYLSSGAAKAVTSLDADLLDSSCDAGTYSAVSVDAKGLVTAGAQVVEVGSTGQTEPSSSLATGGLFFLEI